MSSKFEKALGKTVIGFLVTIVGYLIAVGIYTIIYGNSFFYNAAYALGYITGTFSSWF